MFCREADTQKLNNKRYTITLDDDPMIAKVIEATMGVKSVAFLSAKTLLEEAHRHHPLAAFVDINIGVDECGLEVIPELRALWIYSPIIVITSDPTDDAVSKALNFGADDFLQKPIRPKELLARLQARLGDLSQRQSSTLRHVGDTTLDPIRHILKGPVGQKYISSTETSLLLCLIEAKGTIVSKERLKRRGWKEIVVSDNALDRKIFELRRAFKEVSQTITLRNVYGEGLTLQTHAAQTSEVPGEVNLKKVGNK